MKATTSAHVAHEGRTPGELLEDVLRAVENTGVAVLEATSRPLPHDNARHFVTVTWADELDAFDPGVLNAVTCAVLA